MSKKPILTEVEFGTLFGVWVVRGVVNGERRAAMLRYSARGILGVSWDTPGTEARWRWWLDRDDDYGRHGADDT